MKNQAIQKGIVTCIILVLSLLTAYEHACACSNLVPNFTTSSPGCGIPRMITLSNTSTGTLANTSSYVWKVNGVKFDSTVGTAAATTFTANTPGTYVFKLIARTSAGCYDSSVTKTVTITTNAPAILDASGNPVYNPTWTNCILNPLAVNTFDVDIISPQVLNSYTIKWGDGSPDNTGASLAAGALITHSYPALGIYNMSIVTVNGGCTDTVKGTVYNLRPPVPSILPLTGGTYSGCAPLQVTFRDSTLYALEGTTLSWDFGVPGGQFTRTYQDANDTISFTYPLSSALATCPKSITLRVSNPQCGSPVTSSLVGFVNVFNKSAASIGLPNPLCQASRTYTFTNTSNNNCVGGDRYFWRTVDSTIGWTSSKGPVTITFPTLGSQTIRLIDSNACGVDSTTATIVINRPPLAGFTASPLEGCQPLVVNFTDTSLGLSLVRTWNFGDPASGTNTSSAATPTHTFNNPGTYTVSLTVSNACTPSSNTTKTIRVYARPVVAIGGASSGCVPHTVTLANNTTNLSPAAKILWDFGGGDTTSANTPGPRTFSTPGSYPVKLKIIDTCGTDSAIVTINVSTIPVAAFTASTECRGDSTAFTDASILAPGDVITAQRWYFGDGDSSSAANPKHMYATSGTFQAVHRITTDKTCVDFDTVMVTVKAAPVMSFTNTPVNICDGSIVTLDGTASGTITNYEWTFGTGDTAHAEDTVYRFPSAGNYTVRYKALNNIGCATTISRALTVNPLPDARFGATTACLGQATAFKDSSAVTAGNTITQWAWDFNHDGITDSTTQHPTFLFGSPGTFNVRLKVGTNNNCFNTDSLNIIVNALPTVAISTPQSSLCKLDSFTFNNTSAGAVSYTWKFGDTAANFITASNASFKKPYTDTGLFVVRMIATTNNGCKDSASLTLHARPFPVAKFVTNDTLSCAPKNFTFTNQSGLADSYRWFVNGMQSSTALNRPDTNVLLSGQTMVISLVATNVFGCRPDTARRTLQTISNPVPAFTLSADSGCGPLNVHFSNTSTNATSYRWTFGNGKDTTQASPDAAYAASQTNDTLYTVKLVAMNGPGCKDSLSRTVKVFPQPVSAFTHAVQNGCGPLPVSFINASVHNSSGTISDMTFQWTFGNGNNSTVRDPSQRFAASLKQDTVYPVKLVAFSKYGCSDTAVSSIRVYPNASAVFSSSVPDGCGPLNVNFSNTSVPNDTGNISIMSFAWDFRNGTTSTAVTPSASFTSHPAKDTIYNVRLIAFSEHGCPDTAYKNIRVYPKPLSAFTVSDTAGCGPLNVQLTNHSVPHDTGTIRIMSFIWDLGNGFNSIDTNTASQYLDASLKDTTYRITLYAFSEHGCRDTSRQDVRVHPKPVVGFTTNKTQGCGPLDVSFTNTSQLGASYHWDFGDGDTSALASPLHRFRSYNLYDSIYTVSFATRSVFGCKSDTAHTNIIAKYDPIADFSMSADSICGGGNIAFFNTSAGGVSNSWSFGNGNTSALINPVAAFSGLPTRDTTYFVRLIVTTPYNCKDTVIRPVRINPLPDASFASVLPGCTPLQVSFSNTSLRADKYEWDFGDATGDSVAAPLKIFENSLALANRVFPVTLKVYSVSGCTDTAKRNITVYPKPHAAFVASRSPRCDTVEYSMLNSSTGANSYHWDFADGDTSNVMNPLHYYRKSQIVNPSKDTIYQVRLIATSANGCKDTVFNPAGIAPKPLAAFTVSDSAGCGPLNVSFTNQSTTFDPATIGSMTFLWSFGNGFNSTDKAPATQYLAAPLNDTVYTVRLLAYGPFSCPDTAYKKIRVHPQPVISFSPDKNQGCGPLQVQFTNTSQLAVSYKWLFGDGDSAIAVSPAHTFDSYKLFDTTYTVSLSGVTAFGCTAQPVKRNIIARYDPVADFVTSDDSICGSGKVSFFNTSVGGANNDWDFGNGRIASSINSSSTFNALPARDTTYTVRLITSTLYNCKDTLEMPVKVNALPDAFFATVAPGCTPLNVTFSNVSQRAVSYEWDFGDATLSSSAAPSKVFDNPVALADRVYTVTLKAYSASGCTDTIKRNITVYPKPIPDFSANKTLRCDTASFNMLNSTIGAAQFLWKYGDGNSDNAVTPLHYYRTAANNDTTYTVRLIATSANSCKDSTDRTIVVRPLVRAQFAASNTSSCANLNVQFNNLSQNAVNYFWNFGDASGSSFPNPSHQYFNTGSYKVSLIAFDLAGCSDTAQKPSYINVYEVPKAGFLASPQPTALPDATVSFTDVSIIGSGTLTHDWDFGDPASAANTSAASNASHTFSDSGNYEVRLIVTSNFNCSDTARHIIRIDPHAPLASFSYDPANGCVPHTVNFTNKSQYADTYSWNFGDASNATDKDPVHTYTVPGTYNVFLRATGPGGIDDSTQVQIITVYPLPKANFIAAPLNLYLPDAVVDLTNTSYDAAKSRWTLFKKDESAPYWEDTSRNSTFHFPDDGIFSVRLIVTSALGCVDTLMRYEIVTVNKGGTIFIPNAFTPNGDGSNDLFIPIHTGVVPQRYSFRVYDRWGLEVFSTTDVKQGWDGNILGIPGISETYVWVVEGEFTGGDGFSKKGQVTLLR